MSEILFLNSHTIASQLLNGFCQIDGVPENNRCDHQIESTGSILLIFVGSITDFSQLVVADCIPQKDANLFPANLVA